MVSRDVCIPALILSLLLLRPGEHASAQDTSNVSPVRLALLSGITIGSAIPIHIYQKNAWWLGERAPFRFENDWEYAQNVDKAGHMYAGYLIARVFTASFQWSGLSERASLLYGSLLGVSYQMYVEIEDGFRRGYGFSPGDACFDILGAAIPVAQWTFPVLSNFTLKYSYWPSTRFRDELKAGGRNVFFDDYQGTTFWLGVDPHFMMGRALSDVVPAWLGFAIGFGARDMHELDGGRRQVTLALDINLSRLKTESSFLHSVFTVVDFVHLPTPGIRFDGARVVFGIFYP